MKSCIIIEDQAPAQRVLKKYISDIGSLELKETFSDAIQALDYLKVNAIDLIFLDIHLPKISGIDFLKTLPHPPAVILTTAFSDYAVQSYELNVVDYLLKPFSFERFASAVSKVDVSTEHQLIKNSLDFFIKSGYDYIKTNSDDVLYIQSDMDYTELHLSDEKKLLSNDTLSSWEEKLNSFQFIRVHKSYLVNLSKVLKVSGNQITLENNAAIPIGRAYKDGFLSKYVK
tara:strand:+ start:1748 stop:2434 length:687 start_codon:yes stop_codon:yes gene_type:complete